MTLLSFLATVKKKLLDRTAGCLGCVSLIFHVSPRPPLHEECREIAREIHERSLKRSARMKAYKQRVSAHAQGSEESINKRDGDGAADTQQSAEQPGSRTEAEPSQARRGRAGTILSTGQNACRRTYYEEARREPFGGIRNSAPEAVAIRK